MNFQKKKPWRSEKYLAWVREQDCVMTGAPADDAHHIIGLGGLGGMGTKAPDYATMPLTRGSHQRIHTQSELWPNQWEWIARTLMKAIDDGVLTVA